MECSSSFIVAFEKVASYVSEHKGSFPQRRSPLPVAVCI